LKPAREVERAAAVVRGVVPPLKEDRVLAGEIERLALAVRAGKFDEWRG
jgi:histidine ammonia-lyase